MFKYKTLLMLEHKNPLVVESLPLRDSGHPMQRKKERGGEKRKEQRSKTEEKRIKQTLYVILVHMRLNDKHVCNAHCWKQL